MVASFIVTIISNLLWRSFCPIVMQSKKIKQKKKSLKPRIKKPRLALADIIKNSSANFDADADAAQAQTDFLNQLSHELRTPLSVIKMTIEAMDDGMFESNDEAFKRVRKKIEDFERKINSLMKDQ